ncbi:membrane fusion protein (multidrug efflux system) [Rhodovulum bhavnagarense]|uniref:Membrane fusion protein (Multidrug efflux system) n=1 Tax=Rhodovulum bhavnagarense TaxID=992286 RepID=A0A4V2SWH4_9RHOB|nr:efflux RND transporter periplasmic adaptor subunit [Rhodovulum bhavnagarense]TCP62336.1 membrane fusion protein (multidrug efflux system) [Rhodovulum bhavnagarense]
MPRSVWVFAALLGLSLALLVPPAQAQQGGGPDRPPQSVTVVTLDAQDVTLTATLPGRVVASGVAEVRPQVAGIIKERLFEEGAEVALGDALYRIDAATYEAGVAAARAAVAQAQATLNAARKEADRLQTLMDRNVTSQQALDDALAAREAAAAGVQVAQAGLLAAEIDLDRTTVRAPLSGRVGRSLTTRGALVTAGQAEPLAVIRTLDPVYVDVTMSAAELVSWRRGHMDAQLGDADRSVTLRLPDRGGYDHTGLLTAAEPQVDPLTGVVVLRMTFPNPDKFLLPGMYVQVELPQGVAENVILAPQSAVSRDRRGRPTAMVVTPQNTVEMRVLDVIRDLGNDWIVRSGLADGDRLIVEGLQKVAPGATVAPRERGAEPQN